MKALVFVFLVGAILAGCQLVSADEGTASQAQELPAGEMLLEQDKEFVKRLFYWLPKIAGLPRFNEHDRLVLGLVIGSAYLDSDKTAFTLREVLAMYETARKGERVSIKSITDSLHHLTAAGLLIGETTYRPGLTIPAELQPLDPPAELPPLDPPAELPPPVDPPADSPCDSLQNVTALDLQTADGFARVNNQLMACLIRLSVTPD